MKYVKFFLLCIFSLALGWALGWWLFPANAQEDSLVLQTTTDNILNSEKITETHKDKAGKILNAEEVIKYDYISQEKIDGEFLFEKRPYTNARIISHSKDGRYVVHFYGRDMFAQTPGGVYQIKIATTTIQAWDIQTKQSSFQKIKNLLYRPVYANDFYSSGGDGTIKKNDSADWTTTHNATDGTTAYTSDESDYAGFVGWEGVSRWIERGFFVFDTSAIPDTATIDSATANFHTGGVLYNSDNDGNDFLSIVQTTQADYTTLTTADFDQCGAVSNPPEGSSRQDLTGLATEAYFTLTLNSTGFGWINKTGKTQIGLREGHDILNDPFSPVTGYNGILIYTSRSDGKDPYLSVTWTEGEPPAPPEATSTPTLAPHIDYLYYLDTNGSTTSLLYVPFIDLLLVFLALFLAIILCAFFYYVDVLRKK